MLMLDLFSGVGGFSIAADRVGIRTAAFCELDLFARRVLARHWPEVPCFEDIRNLTAESLQQRGVERIDIVTFGFPCQDVSVAGQRAGLAGDRTGLFWEAIRVVQAVRPDWVIAENVPGLLSSNDGRDMAAVVGAFAECGYVGAWRLLDAQFDNLAQRRARLFFVAGVGAAGQRAVQLVTEGGKRHPAPRREAGESVAAPLESGASLPGGDRPPGSTADNAENLVVTGTLQASGAGTRCTAGIASEVDFLVTAPLMGSGAGTARPGNKGTEVELLVCFNGQSGGDVRLSLCRDGEPSLQASQVPALCIPLYYSHDYNQDRVYGDEGVVPAHTAQDSNRARNIFTGARVRRLSPTECERLQGFSRFENGEWQDG